MSQTRVLNVLVRNKRIVSGEKRMFTKILGTVLLFLFLLPYVVTSLFGNVNDIGSLGVVGLALVDWDKELAGGSIYVENRTNVGRERIPLEIYLLDKLARSINTDYHLEALKAQVVLLRTALLEELWETEGSVRGMENRPVGTLQIVDPEYGRGILTQDVIMAVTSTKGIILTYNDKPAKVAYFAVSNGRTRDGCEAFGQGSLPYFKAVECNRDFLAENFSSQKSMGRNEFISAIEKAASITLADDFGIGDMRINRDLSGYVTEIIFETSPDPVTLSGEECRVIWGLSSSSFSIEENRNRIIFNVRGVGHGLGMSQFAANEMAKSDKDYLAILEYFFSGALLNKFE